MAMVMRQLSLVLLVLLMWPILWWVFDSGPLSSSPRMVLTEGSAVGGVRVYGDHRELSDEDAARTTVDDLESAGGFSRRVLAVAIPTGSGWVDDMQIEALESWAEGDISTVSMRYSAAPSAVVYLLHRDRAINSVRALLTELKMRLDRMPENLRPKVIVQGQSLGAYAGEVVLRDPGLDSFIAVRIWQGLPGGATTSASNQAPRHTPARAAETCTLSVVNDDDPIAKLGPDLIGDPELISTLRAIPRSHLQRRGTGHSYLPALPPIGCIPAAEEVH
ncbi:alpha/beta-hydrolase family protein [Corynebacterium pacaense]|uniref:alpha/beta-hydrolase family protein n=1 Tax=Corynebacterium pacaense TaxID=1816684 RepID=UPI001FE929D3|nr:alpha/beta-hydrolase family protein [Corynebacterium pacaense]